MMILFDATIFSLTIGRTIFFIRLSPEIRGNFSLPMLIMRDGKNRHLLTNCSSRTDRLIRKPVFSVSSRFRNGINYETYAWRKDNVYS